MKNIPTSPKIVEIRYKRRMRKIKIAILFIILFIIIIFGLSFLSTIGKMKIENIEVEGNHIIDKDELEKEIYQTISGKYIYLFSRSNSLIYPHKKVYNDLILKFPRIESLKIERNNFKTLKISIKERVGAFLFCGENIPLNKEDVGENCYFVNNDGLIFDKAPYFSGNIYFKYYTSLQNVEDPLGKQMIDVGYFHQLIRFIDSIADTGIRPIYLHMDKDGTNSLYLAHGNNSTMPKILFKKETDLEVLQNNFSLSMKKKEFADEINSKYNTLLYIDLRFKNKVLYKFQQ